MKRRFMFKAAMVTVGLFLFIATAGQVIWAESSPGSGSVDQVKHIKGLLADISTINLLNGLYFTEKQSRQILSLAQEFKAAKDGLSDSTSADDTLAQAEEVLSRLKAEIQKGAPARGKLPKEAFQINQQLKTLKSDHDQLLQQTYSDYEAKVKSVLTEEQLSVVNTFKRCLIPPKDLRDPVRAGQAASNSGVIKMLRRIRTMPEEAFENRRYAIVSRFIDRIDRKKYRMTDREKLEEKEKMLNMLTEIRAMSDVDFELAKEDLAAKVAPEDKLAALKKKMDFRRPERGRIQMPKVVRFLLTERIIPILEERLENKAFITGQL